ncbi:MAG: hypothetical protein HKN04_07335, partial [Rhodothermaceae bacterium]|nr:hypothetical protein [Rhodothermaceae bacterium]
PVDALVLVPPSNTTFRTWAQRSVVANFKPTPFQKDAMHVWLDRLLAIAPMPLPEHGQGFREALDTAYAANDTTSWRHLADRFGATHALVNQAEVLEPLPGRPLVVHGPWALYALLPRLP